MRLFFSFQIRRACVAGLLALLPAAAGAAAAARSAMITSEAALELSAREPGRTLCTLQPELFGKGWNHAGAVADPSRNPSVAGACRRAFRITTADKTTVRGLAEFSPATDGGVRAAYTFTPEKDAELESLYVGVTLPVEQVLGGGWTADGKSGAFPADLAAEPILFFGTVRSFTLKFPSGEEARLAFAAPTPLLLQDDRRWGQTFSVRLGVPSPRGSIFAAGVPLRTEFTVSGTAPWLPVLDKPATVAAGPDWIPVAPELDIVPGSALDFSTQPFRDAPAGRHGRVMATPAGHFAFADSPDQPRRFYGVNLCFTAQYLDHATADRLAERLMRLGYNAVRIHHYEGGLVEGQKDSLTFNPDQLDKFDYLTAALIKRGFYLTTDLFVSRPVTWRELGMSQPGPLKADEFKVLVPVNAAARANWRAFARNLLTHRNPYTGRTYADEPALAWISLINEGNFGNFMEEIRRLPDWKRAWNQWLRQRYGGDSRRLAEAWRLPGGVKGWPETDAVPVPERLDDPTPQARDFLLFCAETERNMVLDMKQFLRNDLGCRALVTNANAWTNYVTGQAARAVYDYADDHFYVDHPQFVESDWRLPSRCPNADPVTGGAVGGAYTGFTRVPGKPFTISEFNYSAPGRYRAAGGLLTGALAAVQDWDAVWRFAYSHTRENVASPSPLNYFDLAVDPLAQAGDRAALLLFLRGDLPPAGAALALSSAQSAPPARLPVPRLAPSWTWAAWLARVGTVAEGIPPPAGWRLPDAPGSAAAGGMDPYAAKNDAVWAWLCAKGLVAAGNPSVVSPRLVRLENDAATIRIETLQETFVVDTPRTVGGVAGMADRVLRSRDGGVAIQVRDCPATVWVSSLDNRPLHESRWLLLTHLTDVQNRGARYAETARRTLLDWGGMPQLAQVGKAEVSLRLDTPSAYRVYALSPAGRRLGEVPAKAERDQLRFTADVAGGGPNASARMLYEIVREK